jgi:nucleotide-binding universal stress UspA family protein
VAIKHILLPLVGDATRTTMSAVEKCVALAKGLNAEITAFAIETEDVAPPTAADVLGATELVQTAPTAKALLAVFHAATVKLAARGEGRLVRSTSARMIGTIAEAARLTDISLALVKTADSLSEMLVERLLFETGRPVLMCPEARADSLPVAFKDVMIAWDHTAPAARAVADALPLLRKAARVRIVTATDQVTSVQRESGASLEHRLAAHGVAARFETVPIAGSSTGKVFEAYVESNAVDLLVMGGYRHSRLNEHFWGGTTATVINQPPCWVMLSH